MYEDVFDDRLVIVRVACGRAAGRKGDFAGGSDTFGAGAVVGRDGGEESVAGGVLAVQELQGGFVTEREVGRDIAEFQQDIVELSERGRDVQVCFE